MASNVIPVTVPAPQPGLRSFIVYDEVPDNCVIHEVRDDGVAPHFVRGEFALADIEDRTPINDELFLIQWNSGDREVALLKKRTFNFWDPKTQTSAPGEGWMIVTKSFMVTLGTGERESVRWADGPYDEEHLMEKIVGRVVGIYEPDFMPMLRAA